VPTVLELSACLEWLFWEEPVFADRVARAVEAGISRVEFWTWRDKDVSAIGSALAETGARLEAFVSEPQGQLVDARTHDAFTAGVAESAQTSRLLGCDSLIVLAGERMHDVTDGDQRRAVVAALGRAAPVADEQGITLLLEPLNTRLDHVGHFLDSTLEGLAIIEEVAEPNVRLLLDLYHSAVMSERLEEVVGDHLSLVGHIHVADAPGRHEPGTGSIEWPAAIRWLERSGYTGRLGLEYRPTGDSVSSLSFINRVLARRP
jgi:hydroxypyruvate isomerase